MSISIDVLARRLHVAPEDIRASIDTAVENDIAARAQLLTPTGELTDSGAAIITDLAADGTIPRQMTHPQLLRAQAATIRRRAHLANLPAIALAAGWYNAVDLANTATNQRTRLTPAEAEHIAGWTPELATALADWLVAEADAADADDRTVHPAALAVATAHFYSPGGAR